MFDAAEEIVFFDEEVAERKEQEAIEINLVKDVVGREYACIENIAAKYSAAKQWATTIEEIVVAAEDLASLLKWGEELRAANALLRLLKQAIWVLDKDKLPFIDGGKQDDCWDITSQSVVFTELGENSVVPNGPEYYGEFHRFKDGWQLVATEANYEISIMRQALYPNTPVNTWNNDEPYGAETANVYRVTSICDVIIPKKGFGPNVEQILFWLWRNQEEDLEKGKPKTALSSLPLRKLDFLTGEWKMYDKEAHPVNAILVPTLRWMRDRNIVSIHKSEGEWYISPLISRIQYQLSGVDIDDFDVIPEKKKYLPIMYNRAGAWYPRVGILFDGNHPLFVDRWWTPKQEFKEEAVNGHIFKKFVSGGIPFVGSYQLSPEKGKEYHPQGKYCYCPSFGSTLVSTFLSKVAKGTVKTCIKSETAQEKEPFWTGVNWGWKVVGEKVHYVRQAYWVVNIPPGSFMIRFPKQEQRENVQIVLFCDIVGEAIPQTTVGYSRI